MTSLLLAEKNLLHITLELQLNLYIDTNYRVPLLKQNLKKKKSDSEGMVYVEGLYPQTVSDFLSPKKNGFYIDRYEVTNQQFKEFIDQGGYQNPEFWQNEFILMLRRKKRNPLIKNP